MYYDVQFAFLLRRATENLHTSQSSTDLRMILATQPPWLSLVKLCRANSTHVQKNKNGEQGKKLIEHRLTLRHNQRWGGNSRGVVIK